MGAGSDVLGDCQMSEELFDFRRAHGFWVTFAVEEDELPDPADIRFFGAFGVVEQPDFFADAIEESGLGSGGELGRKRFGGGYRPPLARDRAPAIVSTELSIFSATRSTPAMAVPCRLEHTAAFVEVYVAVLFAVHRRRREAVPIGIPRR